MYNISLLYIYIFIYQAIQNIEYIKQDWIIFQYKLNSVYTLQLINKLVCWIYKTSRLETCSIKPASFDRWQYVLMMCLIWWDWLWWRRFLNTEQESPRNFGTRQTIIVAAACVSMFKFLFAENSYKRSTEMYNTITITISFRKDMNTWCLIGKYFLTTRKNRSRGIPLHSSSRLNNSTSGYLLYLCIFLQIFRTWWNKWS